MKLAAFTGLPTNDPHLYYRDEPPDFEGPNSAPSDVLQILYDLPLTGKTPESVISNRTANNIISSHRGISFLRGMYDYTAAPPKLINVVEKHHIGRDAVTIGLAYQYRYQEILANKEVKPPLTVGGNYGTNASLEDTCIYAFGSINSHGKPGSHSYTLTHSCETLANDTVNYESKIGRLVAYTGQPGITDKNGNRILSWKNDLSVREAMSSVHMVPHQECPHWAGILIEVPIINDKNMYEREVMGQTIRSQHHGENTKILDICDKGDCYAEIIKPLLTEIPFTKTLLSGVYNDSENNKYLVNVDDNSYTIKRESSNPTTRTLNNELLSGVYTKSINGVEQDEKYILQVNPDLSFTMNTILTENDSMLSRITLLENIILNLTNS